MTDSAGLRVALGVAVALCALLWLSWIRAVFSGRALVQRVAD